MLDREGTARPERRSALIDRELERYNVDIAALSETRLADVGEEPESTYTFFWSGKPAAEKREAGVGFAIRSKLVPSLKEKPKAINCRLMTVRLALPQQRCATLISVYAPTLQHSDESKEEFYSELRNVIDSIQGRSYHLANHGQNYSCGPPVASGPSGSPEFKHHLYPPPPPPAQKYRLYFPTQL